MEHRCKVRALEAAPPDGWPDGPQKAKRRTRVYVVSEDETESWQLQAPPDMVAGLRLGDPVLITVRFGADA